jgi:hypothetical protein
MGATALASGTALPVHLYLDAVVAFRGHVLAGLADDDRGVDAGDGRFRMQQRAAAVGGQRTPWDIGA